MEKDKLPEWLKGHAKQFELRPQQGSFEVMMRKREQQRKQRKLFVWLSMSAIVAMVMSAGIWFAANKPEPIALHEQTPASLQPVPENNQSKVEHSGKGETYRDKAISSTASADTNNNQSLSNTASASTTNSHSRNKEMLANHLPSRGFAPPVTIIEAQRKEMVEKAGSDKPIENMTQSNDAIVASTTTSAAYPDSISIKALVPDSIPVVASVDSINQPTGDPSMETLSIKPTSKQAYWSIMGVFTPQLINEVYNTNSFASLSWMKRYIENREQNDQAQYSFNAGIKVERTLGKHWSVSTGLLFSKVQFEEIKIMEALPVDTPFKQALVTGENAKRAVAENQNRLDISFSSLEVPVQVAYRLGHKNMYYQVTAGMSYAYLFQTRSLIFDEKDSAVNVQETNDANNGRLNQHSVMLLGGMNVGYFFSKRWSCYAGPVYRYSLNAIYNKDYFIGPRPYYLGLELGVKYSFR